MTRSAALIALATALQACAVATTEVAPIRAGTALDTDEARIWELAAEAEQRTERRGRLVAAPELDAYLLDVARRLEPPEVLGAIPFRVRVVAEAAPCAASLPHGALYVCTGLLARAASEAEVAFVLAHEMAHAKLRHALREQRRGQQWGLTFGTWSVAAAMMSYSRELEQEADADAFERLRAAGYDLADAPRILERTREWEAAEGMKDNATLASHPRIEQRIETVRALVAAAPRGGTRNGEAYVRRTRGILLENGRLELAAGWFIAARAQAQRYLALEPEDAAGHVLLGEIARRESGADSDHAAAASYRRAIELDARRADAWRGLGLVLAKKGERAEARKAIARYLELVPDAPDGALVRAVVADSPGGKQ